MTPPFVVLHVCVGNICRSPMAERLLAARVAGVAGPDRGAGLLLSHSAGTGGWHVGEPMEPQAARQLSARGGDPSGFRARRLDTGHLDSSDLILTATGEVSGYVLGLRPHAAPRTFVVGELARLLRGIDPVELPPAAAQPEAVHARGVALVKLLDQRRDGRPPLPDDDLADPYGLGDAHFARVADRIDDAVSALAAVLLGS